MTQREIDAIHAATDRNRNARQVTVLLVFASKIIRKQLDASREIRDARWSLQRTQFRMVSQIGPDAELPSRPPGAESVSCQTASA